jgi:hypothetical protein
MSSPFLAAPPSEQRGSPPRAYHALVVLLFALGLSLPLIDWAFRIDHTLELTENRVAAKAPHWPHSWAALKKLPKEIDAYWNDAFGFRRRLILWQAMARYRVGVSPSSQVIVGKKGWLFYAGDDSIRQHRGLRLLSAEDLATWQRQLEARRDWLKGLGAHFLFVIAPDKQSVYPEEVPRRFGGAATTPLDQLVNHLRAHSTVDVLDLRSALRAAKKDGPVYCQTDTHWSDRGSYAAYQAIMGRVTAWYPQIVARPPSDFSAQESRRWSGDLAAMLGLGGFLVEQDRQLVPQPPVSLQDLPTDGYAPPTTLRYVRMQTVPESSSGPRAVVFHDSFFLAPEERRSGQPTPPWGPPPATFHLIPLLAEKFSRATFTWQKRFDAELIKREHPDVVIEERVERVLVNGPEGAVPGSRRLDRPTTPSDL